jgi:hypothetical protein
LLTVDGSEDDLISLEGLGQIDLSEAGLAAAKVGATSHAAAAVRRTLTKEEMNEKVVAAAMVGSVATALAKEVASAAAATVASAAVATAAASAASACSATDPITDPHIVDAHHDAAPNGGGFAAVLFDEDDPCCSKDAAVFDEDDVGSEDDVAFEKDPVVSFEGALAGRHIDAVPLDYGLPDPLKVFPPSSCMHQSTTGATCDTTPHGSPRRAAWCCTTRAPTTMVEAGW